MTTKEKIERLIQSLKTDKKNNNLSIKRQWQLMEDPNMGYEEWKTRKETIESFKEMRRMINSQLFILACALQEDDQFFIDIDRKMEGE